jgi:glycerophosphoryl diester phosphodiesterase
MKIIAHRGLRSKYPENTRIAIAQALQLPLHGVEFDCELPREGAPVVVHQETLEPNEAFTSLQLAKRDYTSRDWVIERSAEEISKLNAGSWFGDAWSDLRVPCLPDVLRLPWGEVVAYVELKDATFWRDPDTREVTRPSRVVDAAYPYLHTFEGKLSVVSFNPEILLELRERDRSIPTILALWTEWSARIGEAIDLALRCGASGISLADQMILQSPDWVKAGHAAGLEVHAYPVSPARDEPEFQNWTAASQEPTWRILRDYGIDALVTDFAEESIEVEKSQFSA